MSPNGKGSSNGDEPLEKDYGHGNLNNNNLTAGANDTAGDSLQRIRTAGSISIPPDLFEKLYLSPENRVKGELRKTFGNPTPLALIGFLLSLTPLSCDLMGWRGAGGTGAASTGVYVGFGGVLMILGSVGEWIVGNTFPFVVFGTFGAFWIAFACTLVPWFNAYGAYVTDPDQAALSMGNPGNPLGLQQPSFNASFAFFLLFMGLVTFIFLICSIRTNIAFMIIFLTITCAFACLAAAFWNLALVYENTSNAAALTRASRLTVAGGAFAFVTSLAGWWIFVAIILASVDFPFSLPVGDLSTLVKGASERQKSSSAV